jgi:Caspase domain
MVPSTPLQLEQAIVRRRPALNASVAVALFYFSGHGSKYHEREFMLCKDWEGGDGSAEDINHAKRKYGVSLEDVIKCMNGTQASIVLLDACRSYFDKAEPLDSSLLSVRDCSGSQQHCAASDGFSRGAFRVLPPSVDPCKVLAGYSCSDGSVALDGVQRSEKSPYTTAILNVSHTTMYHSNTSAVLLRYQHADSSVYFPATLQRLNGTTVVYRALGQACVDVRRLTGAGNTHMVVYLHLSTNCG